MAEDIHSRRTAKQAQDPVCKMIVDVEKAAARIEHGEHAHYFCSEKCKHEFEKNPKKYH
ncbi:MAG: YHS domain-containing protein [Acidobacteria bacterium]|nr:MAG: YHS domain-containing protein [Acidobacteriota bacterium]